MATLVEFSTGQDAYPDVLARLRLFGRKQDSRNGPVRQLDDFTIALESPFRALPVGTGRKLNRKIAAAEALQLIGGFSDPEWLCNIAPQFKRFREDGNIKGGWFHGAYGVRIASYAQLDVAVERLREDVPSRQAVVTIWDPEVDTEPNHLDYPCTVALGFSVRNGQYLDARAVMRSNDAWLGLPYDLFQFTQLQLSLCNVLNLLPGAYTHTAWSMHLYEADLEASYAVDQVPTSYVTHDTYGIGLLGGTLDQVRLRAEQIHHGFEPDDVTDSERWYLDVLAS